jgi:hypothetical protein
MNDPYFQWLCKRVGIPEKKHYVLMAQELHELIFRPGDAIETDKNRANDGLQLRVEFMNRYGMIGSSVNRGPCTMLEFLIGLAQRMSYVMGTDENDLHTAHYFWAMIGNLRLNKLEDGRYEELNGDFFVDEAADRVMFRNYEWDGSGGLFPLKQCRHDQRKTEIWYQMQSWLLESDELELE